MRLPATVGATVICARRFILYMQRRNTFGERLWQVGGMAYYESHTDPRSVEASAAVFGGDCVGPRIRDACARLCLLHDVVSILIYGLRFGWLVGWLVIWLVIWLFTWLVGWLVGRSLGWLVDWLVG
jgi:hypothetical protein